MENEIKIELIRSDRRTVAIEITPELRVIVRAPRRMKTVDIQTFVDEKAEWLRKHLELMRARIAERSESPSAEPFTSAELEELGRRALETIPPRVAEQARELGVDYGRITVRAQVSRWGSCSSRGDLNFNCLLMLCPDEVIDYVITHELCHRRHMDHLSEFWAMVGSRCPDYAKYRSYLKERGSELIARLRAGK